MNRKTKLAREYAEKYGMGEDECDRLALNSIIALERTEIHFNFQQKCIALGLYSRNIKSKSQ